MGLTNVFSECTLLTVSVLSGFYWSGKIYSQVSYFLNFESLNAVKLMMPVIA